MARKTNKRRYRRGRRRNRRGRSKYMSPKQVISSKSFVKMYYRSYHNLTAVNPTPNTYYRFALNDIYDPDVTGAGAQPPLFDNLMTLYNRFKVHGARISVKGYTNTSDVIRYGVVYRGIDTTDISNPGIWDPLSVPLSKAEVLHQNSDTSPRWQSIYCNFNKLVADYSTSVNYVGTSSSSPLNRLYADVYAQNLSLASNINIWVEVTMCFYVELTNTSTLEEADYD